MCLRNGEHGIFAFLADISVSLATLFMEDNGAIRITYVRILSYLMSVPSALGIFVPVRSDCKFDRSRNVMRETCHCRYLRALLRVNVLAVESARGVRSHLFSLL